MENSYNNQKKQYRRRYHKSSRYNKADLAQKGAKLLFSNIGYLPTALRTFSELKKDNPRNYDSIKFHIGLESEKDDTLARARWLCKEVIVEPQKLIDKMPEIIGRQYQGQWAIYACSMTCFALSNIIKRWPELTNEFIGKIPQLINLVMTDEIKYYDSSMWKEDPLSTLDGNKSHMTYLSILAWMITSYKRVSDDKRYDNLLDKICSALYRRMLHQPNGNLPSFPNGIVFLPDMMFTLVSLNNYPKLTGNHPEYQEVVKRWLDNARRNLIDPKTGLLISLYYKNGRRGVMMGSYSALNCSCLAFIDKDFARQQYELFKKHFARNGKYCGFNEYLDGDRNLSFHIDAGPIIYGMSPTGTAFSFGAATILEDWKFRQGMLNTCELAGKTLHSRGMSHYKLAEIMLTGEAITLGMRTAIYN